MPCGMRLIQSSEEDETILDFGLRLSDGHF
jgi:hypothetical protein